MRAPRELGAFWSATGQPMANETTDSPAPNGEVSSSDSRRATPWYRRRWVIVAVVVVLGLFLLHHFTRSPPKAAGGRGQQGNASITVSESRSGDMGIYVQALGTVTPIYTVTVYSQIT